MSRGLHVLARRGPLVGIDWLDFASKATGQIAATATKPASSDATARAMADAERARVEAEASNTKWYVAGAVAVIGIIGFILAKVVQK